MADDLNSTRLRVIEAAIGRYVADRLRAYDASDHASSQAPCCGGMLDELISLFESGEINKLQAPSKPKRVNPLPSDLLDELTGLSESGLSDKPQSSSKPSDGSLERSSEPRFITGHAAYACALEGAPLYVRSMDMTTCEVRYSKWSLVPISDRTKALRGAAWRVYNVPECYGVHEDWKKENP